MKAAKRVAWNVRKLRVRAGLSQEALAFNADVDVSYISLIETARDNPSIGLLERLAGALKSDISELLAVPPKGEKAPQPLKSGRHATKRTKAG